MPRSPARTITRAFVRAVGRARQQDAPAPKGLRRAVLLTAIFRVMPRQIDRRRARDTSGSVEWRIRDGEGGVDIWTLRIEDGKATTKRKGADRPTARVEMHTGDFLAVVTGNANGVALWADGRIQIEGDYWFVGQLPTLFRVPRKSKQTR